ncbi:UvrD-helicase domain-containing protein [Leeia aquatica]|uniref:DNA 3'-5' helicase n=1 Tax=Leeia aquatica TaxID=2725557 RepID=A0A847SJQ6_9NEIS|nr:UvrD-helicase domain-containing protein [Leeia aquatica]NLR76142.1 UvrD-helicase domain-containing protein [Leeia aquatica]
MRDDFLSGLNPEQLAAVTLPHESALILAGAGSGKTRVLTTRIAWLVDSGLASPFGLMAVTFTNKAAREMLTRLTAMLPINTRGMWVGTFHGLCNRLLRAHHRECGLPAAFQILDMQDQLALIKRVMRALNVDEERTPPRQVQQFINSQKESGIRASACESYDPQTRRYIDVYGEYEQQCQREGVVDFAELLLRAYELLSRNAMLREHYQQRFRHILVDEFQDTNRLQYQWLKLLGGPDTAMFVVGDDDQSIYAFRGANVGNMRDFEREFRIGKVIRLEQNYRSFGNILDAANALIENNEGRLGKQLWTAAGPGEPVRVFEALTDQDEAHFIVEEVRQLHREGTALADMAVLYRSNAQSRLLEHQLFAAGVPYRVYGGLRFFERQEIKHALAYLRLTANRDDDGAWLRVVNFPARGIGARTLEAVQVAAREGGLSLWASCCSRPPGGAAANKLAVFVRLIDELSAEIAELPLPEKIDALLDRSGLRDYYRAEKDGEERLENLEELVNAAQNFQYEVEGGTVEDFLAHASLESGELQAEVAQDALQLMTVHSAKGLEFDAVWVCGLEEGLFPHENSLSAHDGIGEERRLMYVAITRARKRLYLTLATQRQLYGQTRYNLASRFLREIPEPLTQWLNRRPPSSANHGGYAAPRVQTGAAVYAGTQDLQGFRIGQSVKHGRFGQGVIVAAEGSGDDARVQVNFPEAGVKWLLLSYARLEAC